MEKDFVHLHLHTQYSLLDGAIKISELAKKCVANNIGAVAITDHGNMFGSYQFYTKMKSSGIKPIIGMEAYFTTGRMQDRRGGDGKEDIITDTTNYHLILLAKNNTGLKNLMKLSTIAYKDGFYYKPRIDYEVLSKYSDGLIALTACLKGVPARNIVIGKEDVAQEWIGKFKELFGNDLYLEVQANSIPEQETANKELINFAKKFGLKLVATNDAHYLNPEDIEAHQILLAMQTRKIIQQLKEESARSGFGRYENMHFASPIEMYKKFEGKWDGWENALLNTLEIRDKVSDTLELFEDKSYKFPQFFKDNTINVSEYFRNLAEEGLRDRIQKGQIDKRFTEKDYWDRLYYELDVIEKMGFEGYFLIVSDFVRWSKNNDIPVGPGRGSAAGSIVAYSLNITDVDPLRHGLIFERFLNPDRISMPDIDIDFCMDKRDKVVDYVKEKYGENSVARIGTYNTMKARQTLKDVARALGIPYEEADKLSKLIPQGENQGTWLSLEEVARTPIDDLKKTYEENPEIISKVEAFRNLVSGNQTYENLIDIALKLEGLTRHTSLHAAGIVITPTDADNLIPLYVDKDVSEEDDTKKKEKVLATQYDMVALEELGLVKMDFLGLKTLTELQKMKELVKQTKGIDIDFLSIDLDNKEVLDYISEGRTTGVFQLESRGMQDLLRKLKPSKFDELAAVLALYRPGPIQSGMVSKFIERKHDPSKIEYPFPELEDILKETYGLIVYQEQIMFISNKIAGFTMAQADALRKAIGKKKADLMAKIREDFINKSVENGYDKIKVEELWDAIEEFASYSFNKSHSVAYAYLSVWTAYMKYYYPDEFFAVKLSTEKDDKKFINLLKDAKGHNIKILPPDINKSNVDFTIEDNRTIRYGLARIKGIGRESAESIVREREEKGIFKSIEEVFDIKSGENRKISKKILLSLAKAGALSELLKNSQMDIYAFLHNLLNDGILDKMVKDKQKEIEKMAKEQEKKRKKEEKKEERKRKSKLSDQKKIFAFVPNGNEKQKEEREEDIENNDNTITNEVNKADILADVLNSVEIKKYDLLQFEKEVLGFYISKHPLDNYDFIDKMEGYIDISTILEDEENLDGKKCYLVGVVTDLSLKKTRKGDIAVFNLTDKGGIINCIAYSKTYEDCKDVIKDGQAVFIMGEIREDKESGERSILVNSASKIYDIFSYSELLIDLNKEQSQKGNLQYIRNAIEEYISKYDNSGEPLNIRLGEVLDENNEPYVIQTGYKINNKKELVDKISSRCKDYKLIIKI